MNIQDNEAYLARNKFRNGMEVHLDLLPYQEVQLGACLATYDRIFNPFTTNCANAWEECLNKIGEDPIDGIIPVDLYNFLLGYDNFVRGKNWKRLLTTPIPGPTDTGAFWSPSFLK